MEYFPRWELVEHRGADGATYRMKVEGGWLYRTVDRVMSGSQPFYMMCMVFVPEHK